MPMVHRSAGTSSSTLSQTARTSSIVSRRSVRAAVALALLVGGGGNGLAALGEVGGRETGRLGRRDNVLLDHVDHAYKVETTRWAGVVWAVVSGGGRDRRPSKRHK